MVISRAILVNCWPFLASVRAFLCLIEDHLECPDIFSPSESLAHLQTYDSMQPASQDHPVGWRDLVLRRAHRLSVYRDAFLSGEPARLALTAGQPGVDEELGDRSRTRLHRGGRWAYGQKAAGLASI